MNDSLAYLVSIFDDFSRKVKGDSLCEELPLNEYTFQVEERSEKEVELFGYGVKYPKIAFVVDFVNGGKNFFKTMEEKKYFASWLKAINLDMRSQMYLTSLNKYSFEGDLTISSYALKLEMEDVEPKAVLVLTQNRNLNLDLGYPTYYTYSVKEVLENPQLKRDVWNKLQTVAKIGG